MAMKYIKVLELMKAKGGRVEVTDPELSAALGVYKAVGAMSDIRRYAKLEVRAIRDGRKAIAYELVVPVVSADTTSTPTPTA